MIRYHLDDLGWYQFEWLVQSLLKAECGLAVESWGGQGDYGRDAYSKSPLQFPAKQRNQGPFLFQVKFVQNANAAGAESESLLIAAVSKEVERISERLKHGQWKKPKHYVLATNAPISGALRTKIEGLLQKADTSDEVLILNGGDICDLLDQHENLRRSFPQLLSIRDLDELIHKAVSREVLERSSSAVDAAREIVPVFVPTKSYSKAWRTLRKFNFVVLEGPPEMGKTAIAWMIGLTLLSTGWQALVCDSPTDFFDLYEADSEQVFIADDAFGRTEYDPSRGKEWERLIERILGRVNARHWLVWTSRKHILERAIKTIDLQGRARSFPSSRAVLVDAGHLSRKEKALILYRHSRAASLEQKAKAIIKSNAKWIVENENFTPERIRQFVSDVLPDLAINGGEPNDELLLSEIHKAIQTPTERMRKSFRALSDHHKLLLTTLLETESNPTPKRLQELYEDRSSLISGQYSFDELLEELSESFIKTS